MPDNKSLKLFNNFARLYVDGHKGPVPQGTGHLTIKAGIINGVYAYKSDENVHILPWHRNRGYVFNVRISLRYPKMYSDAGCE
jgi:hypothetical protein